MAKKKGRKKPTGVSGVDANERKKERLEARRRAKAEELARQERAAARRRWRSRSIALAVLLGGSWFFFLRPGNTPTSIEGHPIRSLSASGVSEHTGATVSYESTPPVSGQHAPSPAPCGVHGSQIQNELQVHTLEHGGVGIQYRPDAVDPADIAAIEGLVGEFPSHVFSAPYTGMEPAIAVTSWGRMMELDGFDLSAIRKYVEEFRDNGPESGQSCDPTADDPYQPETEPTPEPSPSG